MLVLMSVAMAQVLPHGHEIPEQMRFFQSLKYTTAEGKVKDGDCEAALALAWVDLKKRVNGKKGDRIVGVWPKDGRTDWEPIDEVYCEVKGKKTIVLMEALVARTGQTPAYPKISGQRVLDIMQGLYGTGGGSLTLAMSGPKIDAEGNSLYLRGSSDKVEMPGTGAEAQRVVLVGLNQSVIPTLPDYAKRLGVLKEVAGVRIKTAVIQVRGDQRLRHDLVVLVPTGAMKAFRAGSLTSRQLIGKSTIRYTPPGGDERLMKIPLSKVGLK